MNVRWSPEGAADFTAIVKHIHQDNAAAALRVARTIYQNVHQLETFSHLGRTGRVDGTRELPLPPLPFVVVYRVKGGAVEIARLLHGAQRWP